MSDLLHVFQSLDARVARLEQGLEQRQSTEQSLSARGQAVTQELRAQRVALARLQRALGSRAALPATRWRRPSEE